MVRPIIDDDENNLQLISNSNGPAPKKTQEMKRRVLLIFGFRFLQMLRAISCPNVTKNAATLCYFMENVKRCGCARVYS